MNDFNDWDQTWELTESAYALLELIEGLKDNGKL